eukprot:CAMPEP_0172800968 /NCGR_PEP_ID=MMETSP1075-20121228/2891_1 /TAXON_ID=2916 /ORGANISM="Ceratium fusus, Strain PA161109" /LENGTH=1188 /DNA_ID=CAMNT_0013638941 /DNA_START=73 /DNA_END=3640 /DNA_ORIENTATION=+
MSSAVLRQSPATTRREVLPSSPPWYAPSTPNRSGGCERVIRTCDGINLTQVPGFSTSGGCINNVNGNMWSQTPKRAHGRTPSSTLQVQSPGGGGVNDLKQSLGLASPTRSRVCRQAPWSPQTKSSSWVAPAPLVAPAPASSGSGTTPVRQQRQQQMSVVEGVSSAPTRNLTWTIEPTSADLTGGFVKKRQNATTPVTTPVPGLATVIHRSRPSIERARTSDTTAVDSSVLRDETPAIRTEQDQKPWALSQTVRLTNDREHDEFIGRARVIDKTVTCSVKNAVEQLNRGMLHCPEGMCLVYSASSTCYFLVYRYDKRDVANTINCSRANKESFAALTKDLPLLQIPGTLPTVPHQISPVVSPINSSARQASVFSVASQPAAEPNDDEQARHSSWVTKAWGLDTTTTQMWHHMLQWQHQQYSKRERCSSCQLYASHQKPAIAWHAGQPSERKPLPELLACTFHADTDVTRHARPSSPCGDGGKCFYTTNEQPEANLQFSTSFTPGGTEVNASQLSIHQASFHDERDNFLDSEVILATAERVATGDRVTNAVTEQRNDTASRAAAAAAAAKAVSAELAAAETAVAEAAAAEAAATEIAAAEAAAAEAAAAEAAAAEAAAAEAAAAEEEAQLETEAELVMPGDEEMEIEQRWGDDEVMPEQSIRTCVGGGDEVEIGNYRFELHEVIGRGAFGVVWRGTQIQNQALEQQDGPYPEDYIVDDVAVKVVTAKDDPGFQAAVFEAELLQILSVSSRSSGKRLGHVPWYFAHRAARSSSSSSYGTVCLAMSIAPGGALDKWLYGISDEEHKTVDVLDLIDGHLPGGQQGSWTLANATTIVRELIFQLCGVFGALQPLAYHRDVSSHNVLVDFADGPDFTLIDFGLSVHSGTWSQEWCNSNLAGDPRYWTPSAWMAFAFGFKCVATHPNTGFQQQYLTRMDHFSLGVLGLETLFALWDRHEGYEEDKCPGLLEVRKAWVKYWVLVIRMFQMFHMQGAHEVRTFLSQSQEEGVASLMEYLRDLRKALRYAALQPANGFCTALLLVLADLIDEKGSVAWVEVPSMLVEDLRLEASAPVGKSSSLVQALERRLEAHASNAETLSQKLERAAQRRLQKQATSQHVVSMRRQSSDDSAEDCDGSGLASSSSIGAFASVDKGFFGVTHGEALRKVSHRNHVAGLILVPGGGMLRLASATHCQTV